MPGGGSSKLTWKEKQRLALGSKQKSIKDFHCTKPKLPLVIFGIFISFSAAFSEIQALPEHRAGSISSKTQLEIILSNRQAFPHLCAMPKIDLSFPWRPRTSCVGSAFPNFGEHYGTLWNSSSQTQGTMSRHRLQNQKPKLLSKFFSRNQHLVRNFSRELPRPRSSYGLTRPQVVPDSKSNWEAMIGRRHRWPAYCSSVFVVDSTSFLKGGWSRIICLDWRVLMYLRCFRVSFTLSMILS